LIGGTPRVLQASFYAGMYCKFEVSGTASDFRASIDSFEVTGGGSRIFNALSAY
jgi:hypothetical protein